MFPIVDMIGRLVTVSVLFGMGGVLLLIYAGLFFALWIFSLAFPDKTRHADDQRH